MTQRLDVLCLASFPVRPVDESMNYENMTIARQTTRGTAS